MMNKFIKSVAIGLSSLLLATGAFACSENPTVSTSDTVLFEDGMSYVVSEKGTPKEYYSLSYDIIGGSDVMPIGGFAVPHVSGGSTDGNNVADLISEYYFQLIEDCGVNLFVYTTDFYEHNPSAQKKLLQLAEDHGIGVYMTSATLASMVGSRTSGTEIEEWDKEMLYDKVMELSSNMQYRSFVGLWLYDEPFPHWQLKNVKSLAEALVELDIPGLTYYCNIVGYWEGESNFWSTCAATTFDSYAEEYMSIPLEMLSATQYPYDNDWTTLSKESQDAKLKSGLFMKLSLYRAIAEENGVPFWRMLQAGGDFGTNKESKGYFPEEGEMLYDINCSLAWGAKGIQYYTLCGHQGDCSTGGETYDTEKSGLFGPDGNINRWYYYAQKANKQIQACDHVLMNAANEGVLVHGDYAKKLVGSNPLAGTKYESNNLILDAYRQLKSVSGDDAIIGCFDYQGGTALYVVNGHRDEKGDVTLNFDDRYCYDVIQRTETVSVVGNSVPLTLAPGEGVLVVLR